MKFNISGSDQLGSTSGWLQSQHPFIHPCTKVLDLSLLWYKSYNSYLRSLLAIFSCLLEKFHYGFCKSVVLVSGTTRLRPL